MHEVFFPFGVRRCLARAGTGPGGIRQERNSMKRATLITALAVFLIALSAGAAIAASFVGNGRPNNINGTNSADFIRGLGGGDTLKGLLGNDRIYGGDGNDTVIGQPGNDTLNGSAGNDDITNNDGRDEAFGGDGNDTIVAVNDTSPDFVNCGPGDDDVARIQANDYVDDTQANQITAGTLGLSCETIVINGVLVVGPPV
jgi:Ca2+-binding RTX toxin-like protein